MEASAGPTTRAQRAIWAVITAAVTVGLGLATPAVANADSAGEAAATIGAPYCTADGAAVDVELTVDPAAYPAGTAVAVEVDYTDDLIDEHDLVVINGQTDASGHFHTAVPIARTGSTSFVIAYAAGTYPDGDIDWVEVGGSGYHLPAKCGSPAPPVDEVCVLEAANGYATVAFRGVRHTIHVPGGVKLSKVCVTAAEATQWAEKLGID